jgi:hypothetical protein
MRIGIREQLAVVVLVTALLPLAVCVDGEIPLIFLILLRHSLEPLARNNIR